MDTQKWGGQNIICVAVDTYVRPKDYSFLKVFKIDLVIVFYWNYLIPKDIVEEYAIFNLHPSFLPKYRGPFPAVFQLLHDETHLGVSLYKMDEDYDTGDIYIYMQEKFCINNDYHLVDMKIYKISIKMIRSLITDFYNGSVSLFKQDHTQASYYSKEDLDNYIINKNTTYQDFVKYSRIFNYYPPFRVLVGTNVYKIISYSLEPINNGKKYNLYDKVVYLILE